METEEEEKWTAVFKEKFVKKKQQLVAKQKIEIESLQVKLKNALNEKLKIREVELEKFSKFPSLFSPSFFRLLQRFQNLKNDLENRQRLEMSKLTVNSTKTIQRMSVSRQSVANINASIDNYLGSKCNFHTFSSFLSSHNNSLRVVETFKSKDNI